MSLVAHAPRNVHRKIPTLSELEVESKGSIPTSEDGLKLNILLGTLVPPTMLVESDTLWTFESLLRVSCFQFFFVMFLTELFCCRKSRMNYLMCPKQQYQARQRHLSQLPLLLSQAILAINNKSQSNPIKTNKQ